VGDVGIDLGPPPTRPTVLIRYPAAAMRKIGLSNCGLAARRGRLPINRRPEFLV
jgi:hypothetical protein